jgi:hypothetical protein
MAKECRGLIKTGAHPRVVQEQLVHSSASFTLQVYGHLVKELQEQSATAFADALDGAYWLARRQKAPAGSTDRGFLFAALGYVRLNYVAGA